MDYCRERERGTGGKDMCRNADINNVIETFLLPSLEEPGTGLEITYE